MGKRLTDPWFEAEFYGNVHADEQGRMTHTRQGNRIDGAQGLQLWCPCGYGKPEFPLDGGRPHAVMVPFRNPRNAPELPPEHGPHSKNDPSQHPRWEMSGSGLEDLTISPSIDVGTPSCWHGFIRNGEVT